MRHLLLFIIFMTYGFACFSQNSGVGIGTTNAHPSALLDLTSTSQGFLPPRMTFAQRNAIINPALGLVVWCTDCLPKGELQVFNGTEWTNMIGGVAAADYVQLPSVKIGKQIWTLNNLNVSTYRNGDSIPQVTNLTQWENLTTGAWCWYNNDSTNFSKFGKLYNWYAVNDPRGLAPQGWHVPSDAEWESMILELDSSANIACQNCTQSNFVGGLIKQPGSSNWVSGNTTIGNDNIFNGLPGGSLQYDVNIAGYRFLNVNEAAFWWTSTAVGNGTSIYKLAEWHNQTIKEYANPANFGQSVRCVRNNDSINLDSGLVAFYPFNGNANDESGNGNNGVVNGSILTTDRFGRENKAYTLNSANSNYISINNNPIGNSNASISGWFYATTPIGGPIFHIGSDNSTPNICNGYFLGFGNIANPTGNTLIIDASCNGNYNTGWDANANNWYHFTVIRNQNTLITYINGNIVGVYTPNSINNPSSNIFFGSTYFSNSVFFNGKLDDIRIYNRALTQAEITYLATH